MAKTKNSKKGKGSYLIYKTENRYLKNKIKKLERHCKNYPNDEIGKKNLEKAKQGKFSPRSKPLVPGSNIFSFSNNIKYKPSKIPHIDTPGEQLSKLLNIPIPKPGRKIPKKTIIKQKPKRK